MRSIPRDQGKTCQLRLRSVEAFHFMFITCVKSVKAFRAVLRQLVDMMYFKDVNVTVLV